MGRRLLALLLVACVSGAAAGIATSAGGAKSGVVAVARIPPLPARAATGPRCPIPNRFRTAFEIAARDTGLPLPMLVAVAEVESQFEPGAQSPAGARGLLQVMPATASDLQLDVDHPTSNVLAGARYLRTLLDQFHSPDLALSAYNAGPAAVDRAGGAPTEETLTYVADVNAIWRSLAGCA